MSGMNGGHLISLGNLSSTSICFMPATTCQQWPASNDLPATTCQQWPASNDLPAMTCQQWPASNDLPTTTCQQRPANNDLPAMPCQQRPANNDLPAMTCQQLLWNVTTQCVTEAHIHQCKVSRCPREKLLDRSCHTFGDVPQYIIHDNWPHFMADGHLFSMRKEPTSTKDLLTSLPTQHCAVWHTPDLPATNYYHIGDRPSTGSLVDTGKTHTSVRSRYVTHCTSMLETTS